MFVDDEKIILDSLCLQIKRAFGNEFAYEAAESAEEAWEIIEELAEEGCNIILIVSDWLMPNIKGDEFLSKVHEKWPETIKIILTGYADDDAIERARQNANLYCVIKKPWSYEELITQIAEALQLSRQ